MKKLLLAALLVVLAMPCTASAVQSSGTPVMVPDGAADAGGEPAAPRSWLFNNVFFVRAHTCRVLGVTICGPDPLISSGNAFNGVIRIWVPFGDTYNVYFFVSDPEGNVVSFTSGAFGLGGGTYTSFFSNFNPIGDGLYKFHGLVIANGSGLISFSDFYQFRVGGPGSGGCCP